MSRVLVTGSAGYLGQALTAELEARGHEVIGYDLRQNQDILDGLLLERRAAGCDAVAHLAAIPYPQPGKRWEDYYLANVTGTHMVAAKAAALGIPRLVYASSTAYYGAHTGFPFALSDGETTANAVQQYTGAEMPPMRGHVASAYNEAALAYACSKVAAETALAAFGMAQRLQVIVLRIAPMPQDGQPYEGMLLDVATAAAAFADAIELDGERWYEVYNVADIGMDTQRWQEVSGV